MGDSGVVEVGDIESAADFLMSSTSSAGVLLRRWYTSEVVKEFTRARCRGALFTSYWVRHGFISWHAQHIQKHRPEKRGDQ